jgi:hypothetical protein
MKKMNLSRLPMLMILSMGMLICACSKSNNKSNTGTGGSNGSFSVKLDGNTVSGTDANNSAVVVLPADPSASFTPDGDIFVGVQSSGDSIGFHLPDRTGITFIGRGSPAHIYGVFSIPNTVYIFDSVSVNVTSLTNTRIQGTFSGHLSTSLLDGQGTHADMTNGTFDLPVIQ